MQFLPRHTDFDAIDALRRQLGISPLLAGALVSRGIVDAREAKEFFEPTLDQLHDPLLLDGMKDAVARIRGAIQGKEKIVVYGDYDTDGVTATAVLIKYLRARGAEADFHIPSRLDDGYGLNEEAVRSIAAGGARLLITVDCGIASSKEVALAQMLSMDVIITDHHEQRGELPRCAAVINPKLGRYPNKGLAGVGVAAKLVEALGGREALCDLIDLVALGTVADIVPLLGENRALVSEGLKKINGAPAPGILALIQSAGIKPKTVRSADIAFRLAPRVNAGGRLGLSARSVHMFLAPDIASALPTALELNEENAQRQRIEADIFTRALEMLEGFDPVGEYAIVLCAPEWNEGVVGIVASRLARLYARPVILLCEKENGLCTGSGRSISGVHLYEAAYACRQRLERFGGHAQAVGLTLHRDHIDAFRRELNRHLAANYAPNTFAHRMAYDLELHDGMPCISAVKELSLLEPTGQNNPRPVFLLSGAQVRSMRTIGKAGEHLIVEIQNDECRLECVAFRLARQAGEIRSMPRADWLLELEADTWNDQARIRAVVQAYKQNTRRETIDILLKGARGKISRAFWKRIGYNSSNIDDVDEKRMRFIGDRDARRAFMLKIVSEAPSGVLLIVRSAEGLGELYEELKREGLEDRLIYRLERPEADLISSNTAVLAWRAEHEPQKKWRTVILWDGCASPGECAAALDLFPNAHLYVMMLPEHAREIRLLLQDGAPSRERMGICYRAMLAAPPAQDRDCYLAALEANTAVCPGHWEAALDIFCSLNLFQVCARDAFHVACAPDPKGARLQDSALYIAICGAASAFEQFAAYFMSKAATE